MKLEDPQYNSLMRAVRYLYVLALALWLGGMVLAGAVVAPTIFSVLEAWNGPAGRVLAGDLFGAILRRLYVVGAVAGGVMFFALTLQRIIGPRPRSYGIRVGLDRPHVRLDRVRRRHPATAHRSPAAAGGRPDDPVGQHQPAAHRVRQAAQSLDHADEPDAGRRARCCSSGRRENRQMGAIVVRRCVEALADGDRPGAVTHRSAARNRQRPQGSRCPTTRGSASTCSTATSSRSDRFSASRRRTRASRSNQGICGAAATHKETIIVDDVDADPRYLACSLETRSEIVVPIMRGVAGPRRDRHRQRQEGGVRPGRSRAARSRGGAARAEVSCMTHTITLIPGDGIGPEVTTCGRDDSRNGRARRPTGRSSPPAPRRSQEYGTTLPEPLLASIRKNKVALKGPITTPIGEGFTSVNVGLRKALEPLRQSPAGLEPAVRAVALSERRSRDRAREHRRPLRRPRARGRPGRRRKPQDHHRGGVDEDRAFCLRPTRAGTSASA